MTCRECGCTETHACVVNGEPCYWVEPNLCSACAVEEEPDFPNLAAAGFEW